MSLALMAQVWELDLPPQEKFILLAYADGATAWPPGVVDLALLARKTGYPLALVRQVMHALGGQPTLLQAEAEP